MIESNADMDGKHSLSVEDLSYRKLGVKAWRADMPWWIILSKVGFSRVGRRGEMRYPGGTGYMKGEG